MDEQQPDADDGFDDEVYVRAWWQRPDYSHGEHRDDEAGHALDWAEGGEMDQVRYGDPVSAGRCSTGSSTRQARSP